MLERQDAVERLNLLEATAHSKILRYELKLAVAKLEGGDFETALRILEAARSEGRISVPSSILLSELLTLFSRLPESIAVLEELLERFPENPDIYRRLTYALQQASEFERAADIFERAIGRWPHDWMLLVRLSRMPIERRRLEHFFEIISNGAEDVLARNERFRFHYARACLLVGKVERALELLHSLVEPVVQGLAAPLMKALSARPAQHWTSGSRLVDDRTKDFQVTRAPNARATFILTINATFGNLPQSLVDTFFADHDVNVVYLRDFRKRSYLRGVAGLGRTELETIAALRKIVAALGAKRTIVMGGSGGGFSAMRYAALMDADVAVSFAGPTDASTTPLYHGARPSAWNPDFFIKAILNRESDLPLDLVPLLSKSGRTKFIQYFGQEMPEDVRQALRLKGLPGVTLRPVPGLDSHYVLDHLMGNGSFDLLLEELATRLAARTPRLMAVSGREISAPPQRLVMGVAGRLIAEEQCTAIAVGPVGPRAVRKKCAEPNDAAGRRLQRRKAFLVEFGLIDLACTEAKHFFCTAGPSRWLPGATSRQPASSVASSR